MPFGLHQNTNVLRRPPGRFAFGMVARYCSPRPRLCLPVHTMACFGVCRSRDTLFFSSSSGELHYEEQRNDPPVSAHLVSTNIDYKKRRRLTFVKMIARLSAPAAPPFRPHLVPRVCSKSAEQQVSLSPLPPQIRPSSCPSQAECRRAKKLDRHLHYRQCEE